MSRGFFGFLPFFFCFCLLPGRAAAGKNLGPGATPSPEAHGPAFAGGDQARSSRFRLESLRPFQLGLARIAAGNDARAAVARRLLGGQGGTPSDQVLDRTQAAVTSLLNKGITTIEALDEHISAADKNDVSPLKDLSDQAHRVIPLSSYEKRLSLETRLDRYMRRARGAAQRVLRRGRFDGFLTDQDLLVALHDVDFLLGKTHAVDALHDPKGTLREAVAQAGGHLMMIHHHRNARRENPPRKKRRPAYPSCRSICRAARGLPGDFSRCWANHRTFDPIKALGTSRLHPSRSKAFG